VRNIRLTREQLTGAMRDRLTFWWATLATITSGRLHLDAAPQQW
jgi:hypothetical protein